MARDMHLKNRQLRLRVQISLRGFSDSTADAYDYVVDEPFILQVPRWPRIGIRCKKNRGNEWTRNACNIMETCFCDCVRVCGNMGIRLKKSKKEICKSTHNHDMKMWSRGSDVILWELIKLAIAPGPICYYNNSNFKLNCSSSRLPWNMETLSLYNSIQFISIRTLSNWFAVMILCMKVASLTDYGISTVRCNPHFHVFWYVWM